MTVGRPPARQADVVALPRVVHSLPGRVRLRQESDDGLELAGRLRAHPSVRLVTSAPAIGSITVHFDPALSFHDLIRTLPVAPASEAAAADGFQIDWTRVAMSCLLALVPLGPVGNVTVALVASLFDQMREAQRARRPAGLAEASPPAAGAAPQELFPALA